MSYFKQKTEGDIKPIAVTRNSIEASQESNPTERAKELLTLAQSMPHGLNFELTKELALECQEDVFERWVPDGEVRGKNYSPVNPTRNDSNPGSFMINIETGVWAEFAGQDQKRGSDLISLVAYVEGGISQSDAARMLLEHLASGSISNTAARSLEKRIQKAKKQSEFTTVMPIPVDALDRRPKYFGPELGSASMCWCYRNTAGEVLFFQNRIDTAKGKTYLPQIYGKDSTGHCCWKLMAPPAPRPAYGLDRLAARAEAPVLFTEGEKAAEAAQRLFPDFVAVTTMNGSKSPEKTDFSPFSGRTVYIAPDNDEAGTAYAKALTKLLHAVNAQVVALMDLRLLAKSGEALPEGYDLADALADGWTAESIAALGEGLWLKPPTAEDAESDQATEAPASSSIASTPNRNADPTNMQIAKEMAQTLYAGQVASFNNQVLAYQNGYWKSLNLELNVKRPILEYLGDRANPGKINSIADLLKISYATAPEEFDRHSNLICLKNGTLDPLAGTLSPHSPDHKLTNALAIEYAAEAKCPLWLQTLDEIFAPDADKTKKIQLVREYMGYCLIPDTRMHKFLWLVGAGGNGKSLVLSVLTALVGSSNISNAAIERLQDKFVRAELVGKLLNISSEMSAQATVSDGYLKQITGGDVIEAERKHEKPFSFRPYVRLIGATNTLPKLLDHSDGFFRRAIILQFNRQFTENERDAHREENLMKELAGILNWAIGGLQDLLNRGRFDVPASSETAIDSYRVNSDPIRQFCGEVGPDFPFLNGPYGVGSSELHQHYRAWSSANGYKDLSIASFGDRLILLGYEKKRDKNGIRWCAGASVKKLDI